MYLVFKELLASSLRVSSYDFINKKSITANYIAVERHPEWFREMLLLFPGGNIKKLNRSIVKYYHYLFSKPVNEWPIPDECSKLKSYQKRLRSPKHIAHFLLKKNSYWYDAKYFNKVENIKFHYYYIFEGFKDQFGESPYKYQYIKDPLALIYENIEEDKQCHAIIIVDGGPRADIVKTVLDLIGQYRSLTVDILLLEAYRKYYDDVLCLFNNAEYIKADKNEMVDGSCYIKNDFRENDTSPYNILMGSETFEQALEKELWHYTNINNQQSKPFLYL